MSQRPFGFGNKQSLMDIYSYERAAPRASGPGGKRYHHPVIPIASGTVPHYAQASQLYPMRTSTESDNAYRYKPGSGVLGTGGRPGSPGQSINIPVLHLGQSKPTVSSPTHSSAHSDSDLHPTTSRSESTETGYRSPCRISSVLSNTGRVGWRSPIANDQEAEVDALTNLLMQSMETRSASSLSGTTSNPLTTGNDGSTSSPAGTLRRGSNSNISLGLHSQIGRLQQHLGMGPGQPSQGANGGRGSPLTTGTGPTTSITGSSATNSPTGSTSSVHNSVELSASGNTIANSSSGSSSCFRCRRPLFPIEGINNGTNLVTLTGALTVKLHVACFTCYRCAAPLRPDAYYHSLRRLLCPTCVRDGAVEMCSNCHRPIGDRVVHALGLPYHPNCFVCIFCGSRLDSRPFTIDVHGRLHCLDDFHRRYAPRCADCGRPIAPEPGSQEARRVVSGDSNYHLECFGVHTISSPLNTKLGTGIAS